MAAGGTDEAVQKGNEKYRATYQADENCGQTDRCNAFFNTYTNEEDCKATFNCNMVMI